MVPTDQQDRIDDAFERIEGTILPCVAMMLETLLDAADTGNVGSGPEAYAAELRTLGHQLEALTREIETASSSRVDAGPYRRTAYR